MADHNPQHGRRPHFHRGRRGPDRRGSERGSPQREHAQDASPRETRETRENGGIDVEQIMRDIRARISQRHGIDLSPQQIQELAARRLEAILEPRHLKPQLLEQLRRSAGAAPDIPASAPIETYEFEDATLYDTHRGILRFFRRLLNPVLKLFFNPTPLIHALNTQARINKELTARELERERRQSEWNALQYELVQRAVAESSRISIEMQALAARIESLSAKVEFNDRKVRALENTPASAPARPSPRHPEAATAPTPQPESTTSESAAPGEGGEGRKRRRRRRGRRGGSGPADSTGAATATAPVDEDVDDVGETDEEESSESVALTEVSAEPVPASPAPPHVDMAAPEVPSSSGANLSADPGPAAAAPDPIVRAPEPVVPSALTPPRDEPRPENPVDRADPGPVDR
jgi:hypothetical protein